MTRDLVLPSENWAGLPPVHMLFFSALEAATVERRSDRPSVIVRVDCPVCLRRKGRYRLARFAEKYGADISNTCWAMR